MQINILKIPDANPNNLGKTQYILYPERIYEICDIKEGCQVYYKHGALQIAGWKARRFKRYIQEEYDDGKIHFLKTEYNFNGFTGVRYFNVAHINAVHSHDKVDHGGNLTDVCSLIMENSGPVKIYHPAHEVAYQIRRIMKRLDQDEEICCAPSSEQDSE